MLQRVPRAQAVVLDMDGLLIDTEPLYKDAFVRAARALGEDFGDDLYRSLVGRSNPECEAIVAKHFGPRFPIDAFHAHWPDIWMASVTSVGMPLKPGVTELLDWITRRGLPVAVATSSDRGFTEFSLAAARLADRLPLRVTGDEIRHGKPAPDIYLEAARRLGVAPAVCVAFEDSAAGVRAASAAGMRVVMVPDLQPPSDDVARLTTAIVPSLHQAVPLLATWFDQ